MRLLGKRQLGQLEVSELITTIIISEIASMPISNKDIPLLYAIIPLIIIMTLEITISFLLSRFSLLRNILSSPPSTLIYKGRIIQDELEKNRISIEELLTELRLKNITDPSHVEYAILEQNGMLSIIPQIQHQQPTLEQLQIYPDESGIVHIIISQGHWNKHNLNLLKKNQAYFEKILKKKHISVEI
jgi:uncharacterized membrane protein YcaP (DUF421 family)